jgi:Zn finger protein HypA/HybF involved in hydrogenase expression
MNEFYGFTYEFDGETVGDSIVTDEATIKAIPEDRYSVGDVPMVVKCLECNEYMVLNDKEPGDALVGEFVCPTCGRSISQFDIFSKMSDEVRENA